MRRSKRLVTDLILIIYCNLYNFYFGAFASQTLTDISKYSIGRLRPHFIEVCKPNINCKSDSNINQYITDYECEKEEWSQAQKDLIRDSRLSFMSGHSSFAAYCMVYLAVSNSDTMLKYLLTFSCFYFFISFIFVGVPSN